MSKPCVLKDGEVYKMWFCSRGERYRIRYAESPDGLVWTRIGAQDKIDVSSEGWDSDMIEYPCVFDHGARRYLLYSGNGYGREGFGIAVWTE
jgi:ribosomal protein L24E